MGHLAVRLFRASTVLVSCVWLIALVFCSVHFWSPNFKPIWERHHASNMSSIIYAKSVRQLHLTLPRPWSMPTSLSCDAAGEKLALADGIRGFVTHPNESGWLGPLSACDDADVAALTFGPNGQLFAVASLASGILPLALPSWSADDGRCHNGLAAVPDGAAVGSDDLASEGPKLDALALDTSPAASNTGGSDSISGIAVQDGHLLALEASPDGGWEIAGAMIPPESARRPVATALYDGRGLLLDDSGAVFELDVSSATWTGPWQLGTGFVWHGICAISDRMGWLALGHRLSNGSSTAGIPELWHFSAPEMK
eukprot:gnl/TRDRNA2_/TRDRNA2_119609_c0_seq2.p1 gnl/TRDRNA2_/TRDRNA2_119609_c0~~gnl/TRDRNA2_/TRDRNA2_119609_c0_seq2.p1  ORF type:complete len:312 (-),score=31.87 gnl/TRDRNA2_/TRDRNA2_119609_c0_seq2:134-1069(-)